MLEEVLHHELPQGIRSCDRLVYIFWELVSAKTYISGGIFGINHISYGTFGKMTLLYKEVKEKLKERRPHVLCKLHIWKIFHRYSQ